MGLKIFYNSLPGSRVDLQEFEDIVEKRAGFLSIFMVLKIL